jgi:6-pyruvoyltetrahydropterin/6-carboxytetrahydropterin synthase
MSGQFEVGVVGGFRARHHLIGDFGPARDEHEHDYRIELIVRGDALRADGTLLDITLINGALHQIATDLTDRDLNQIVGLRAQNPTAEVVARYIFERVAEALSGHGGSSTLAVRVWESADAFAGYSGALA